MAKRVIWSFRARNDRQTILEHWHDRNGNKDYSSKLAEGFRETIRYIAEHNYIGVATDEKNVRIAVCERYLIFYEIKEESVEVLTVWDSRRDPQNLTLD
jgi:plasmid stabilization system protein ParE